MAGSEGKEQVRSGWQLAGEGWGAGAPVLRLTSRAILVHTHPHGHTVAGQLRESLHARFNLAGGGLRVSGSATGCGAGFHRRMGPAFQAASPVLEDVGSTEYGRRETNGPHALLDDLIPHGSRVSSQRPLLPERFTSPNRPSFSNIPPVRLVF